MQASDYDCFDMLYESISNHIHETNSEYDKVSNHKFDLNRNCYIDIVKKIPYILIEIVYTCPCCSSLKNSYVDNLNVPVPIS